MKKIRFVSLLLLFGASLIIPSAWLPAGLRIGGSAGQVVSVQDGSPQALGGARIGGRAGSSEPQVANALAAPAANLTDHRTTGVEPANNCTPPATKANFSPTDQRVYQWTLVSGANIGDTVRWDFRQPDESTYFQTDPITLTFNGNVCLSAFINISGFPAAALTGVWEVRVIYNGVMLTSDSFTISSNTNTVTVTDHRTTGTAPASNCTAPPAKTAFAATDERVYQWTLVAGATTGDRVRWEFVQPDGTVYATSNTLTLSEGGNRCFWVSIEIAGQPAASLPGTWQVRVYYNDLLLLPTPSAFTIGGAQSSCPTVSNLTPSNGPVGTNTTITGTDFTGVTAVRFANNITAQFTVVNNTTITATVPSGAVTGPVTIVKANCSDVQTPPFTIITQPVLEVTPTSLDFGNVATGELSGRILTVRNIGNALLSIESVTSSNPQFTVGLPRPSFGLLPGQSNEIPVDFVPTSGGTKTGTLTFNTNDPNRAAVTIPISGVGLAPVIEVIPTGLNFGELALAQTRDLVLTIRNNGAAALKVTSISSSNLQFNAISFIAKPSNAVLSLPFNIAPGTSVEVTVRFRPSFIPSSIGLQTGVISIDSNDLARPRVDVAVNGTGRGPLISAPTNVSFGSQIICSGTPSTANATITNTGNATLVIAALSIDNPVFMFAPRPTLPLSIAPGASVTLPLSFSTSSTGTQSGRLLVNSNAVNNPGLSIALSGVGAPIPTPAFGGLTVSRTTLSHGRADNVRPVTPFNPFGLADVIGFVFPGGALPVGSIAPGVAPPPLIGGFPGLGAAAIPSAPDPMRITLGGGLANPIVLSAANIPSCFTLVVAEGIVAPDLTRWDRVGPRFGNGNLYASVAIPGTGIFAGMELVTEADLEAYTANSIIYEAPDFGLLVAPAGQNGGTSTLQARARRIPGTTQCQQVSSQPLTTQVEFSRTVRIEILENQTSIVRAGADLEVTVVAQISGNFDPAVNTVVRWGFDGDTIDIVMDEDDMTPPGAPRIVRMRFNVPAAEECKLAQVTVVASSTGNFPFAPPALNPFLEQNPVSIGLFTFRSGGCTVEDTKAIFIRLPDSNCGGGAAVGWVHGIVTNAASGEPIAGATVEVVGAGISTTTGIDGLYRLNSVPAGAQTINASADGFNPRQVQVNVVNGQTTMRDISLQPFAGTVRGMVLNAVDGTPISGATVAVKGTGIAATTGGDGSYILIDVPIGPQTLTASADNFESEDEVVNVIGGVTIAQDFFLTPLVGTITGIVRNATTNLPIAGAAVTAAGVTATTDGSGAYTLTNVPVGSQSVSASATNFNPSSVSVSVPAGATVNQDLTLSPQLGTVTGFVLNDFREPLAGATVTAAGVTATTAADGSYTLSNIPAGPQTVNASATNHQSSSANVAVLGNQTVQQDFTLARRTGNIAGRITDSDTSQPINNASVELLPFPLSFANTNAAGNYTMSGVPPGQQVILAGAPGYYSKIALVNVLADQTVNQDFTLLRQMGAVFGRVLDSTGGKFPGVQVTVVGTSLTATTDNDSTYRLNNVPVGLQTLSVTVTGVGGAQVPVNILVEKVTRQDIQLNTPSGNMIGAVRNSVTGEPLADAIVAIQRGENGPLLLTGTDAGGNYLLGSIPAGVNTVNLYKRGFFAEVTTVTIVASQTLTRDFALMPIISTTTGSVSGIVSSSAAGNPIVAGATITVVGTNISATSGGDGSYTLINVPQGLQTLSASKAGFMTATVPLTVNGGANVTQNFSLTPLMTTGSVSGTIRNAANADPIVGATITVVGTNLSTTSGAGGTYIINNVPSGAQTLSATATGFSSSQVPVTITDGQTLTQNISLSPTLTQGEIRITLNWTKDGSGFPRDLDAHLTGPDANNSCFHVFFSSKGNLNAAPFAQLEVDNIGLPDAPPIETVRISKLSPGIYRFYVYDFRAENPDGLSRSRATVQIFSSTGQGGSFTVPSGAGRFWTVFEINGQTGQVTTINQLASPASNCR